jgi:hypothetical protein
MSQRAGRNHLLVFAESGYANNRWRFGERDGIGAVYAIRGGRA